MAAGVDTLTDYLERARDPGGRHRRLVIVPSPHAGPAVAAALPADALIIAPQALGDRPAMAPEHSRTLLGGDHRDALLDARAGLDLDAFAVISGILRGGGLLVLLTPALADWPTRTDRTLQRWLSWPHEANDCRSHFRERWRRLIEADPAVAVYPAPFVTLPRQQPNTAPSEPDDPECATADQAAAVTAVLRTARGHRRRPSVLTADRGRGKSTALGIAAGRLLAEGRGPILVTAPARASAETLLACVSGRTNGESLRFLPPDELLRHRHPAALLLVDEAAGLPAPTLETLLQRYPRIAFATTTHGYEGTGHGFRIRFSAALDRQTPQWRNCRLAQPVRWAPGDPLEAFTFRALLLDAEPTALPIDNDPSATEVIAEDRAALARDDTALAAFFGLLVDAHYQTRPEDLRRALEAPDTRLWSVRDREGRIVAAAITLNEGALPDVLAPAIARGERRLRGHLLPQSLAAHAGLTRAPTLRFRRIHRIAVHPSRRRCGLGRRLVDGIARATRAERFDTLGTTYGATPELLAFWQRAGLTAVHAGSHRDAASGSQSVFMLHALTTHGASLVADARDALAQDLPWRLAGVLRDTEPAVVAALLVDLPISPPTRRDRDIARAFAHGRRGPDDAGAALQRLALSALAAPRHHWPAPPTDITLLVGRFLQHRDWAALANAAALSGRRAAIERLRTIVAALLSPSDDSR